MDCLTFVLSWQTVTTVRISLDKSIHLFSSRHNMRRVKEINFGLWVQQECRLDLQQSHLWTPDVHLTLDVWLIPHTWQAFEDRRL